MCLSVPVLLFLTVLSWSCQPECHQGIWCPVTMSGMGKCVGVWLSSLWWCLLSRLAGWHLISTWRRGWWQMGGGTRCFILRFLNTMQIWSKWSFCELGVSLPAVLCLFMVSVIQGNSGSASSLFLIVFWESHSGETCRCWFKQYQVYYFVPKDPLHILFRIFYLGLVALHEYFNSEF